MLKIGEFSKLSMLTVKALRFYEKEGLLSPARVDEWTGYRMYDTVQLRTAARIKALRQLGVPMTRSERYSTVRMSERSFWSKRACSRASKPKSPETFP